MVSPSASRDVELIRDWHVGAELRRLGLCLALTLLVAGLGGSAVFVTTLSQPPKHASSIHHGAAGKVEVKRNLSKRKIPDGVSAQQPRTSIFDVEAREISRQAYTKSIIVAQSGEEPVEWVVSEIGNVTVRGGKSLSSARRSQKPPGSVVYARQEGDWIKLPRQRGYIQISTPEHTFLKGRKTSFWLLSNGSCADVHAFPITLASACEMAAVVLNLPDGPLWTSADDPTVPEGCFLKDGKHLRLSSSPESRRNGASKDQHLLCSADPLANHIPSTQTSTSTLTATLTSSTTTSSTRTLAAPGAFPSLFCWLLFMAHSSEAQLARLQYERHLGIFRCHEYTVLSDRKVHLGSGYSSTSIGDMTAPVIDWGSGPTYANAGVFKTAWKAIIDDGRYRTHDWVVKVDADAVFFAERLRLHLERWPQPIGSVYIRNWNDAFGLLGPLEAISRRGWDALADKLDTVCNWPVNKSGEDGFLAACLQKIGVRPITDVDVLENDKGLTCFDGWKAAFHPHKTTGDWLQCFRQARPAGVL